MPISIEADPTLAQGYIKVNGTTAATVTTGGISGIANGAVTPVKLSQPLTLATAQATTSGTSIDFTGIPSWAKRITVMLRQISTSGTSIPQIQIGSGPILTSGYLSATVGGLSGNILTGNIVGSGFALLGAATSSSFTHQGVLTLLHFGSNIWIANGSFNVTDGANFGYFINGIQSLSGALDRVRLTTVNGTDTFDAGSVNIMYEG
jgi:hypothetical protein